MNYRDFIQKMVYAIINPLVKGMMSMGITPNLITFTGFVINVGAAVMLYLACAGLTPASGLCSIAPQAATLIGWSGGVILFAGVFDMMDGRLARMGNKVSAFGALWDSTLDRYSELVSLFSICLLFMALNNMPLVTVTFLAMVGSVMVSYVRARAEGLDIECKVGLMQRPERVVVTAVAAIASGCTANLWWLAGGMILIAALSNVTAIWRVVHCYRKLKNQT